jgi:hypothetical protein
MSRTLAPMFALSLSILSACDKPDGTQVPDGTTGGATGATSGSDTGDPPPVVPQDPDPPELAGALTSLVLGDHAAARAVAEPLTANLTAPSQARAAGLAFALLALAVAEELAENAKEPAEQALAKAEEVRDPEVRQLAQLALGAHLVGIGDAAAAQAAIEAGLAQTGPYAELGKILLAEAVLNQAFDGEEKLTDPGKLDAAQMIYGELVGSPTPVIQGRALTGLAALAKFRGEKADLCKHAAAAAEKLSAAGATEYLKEVPAMLAGEAKCP